VSIDPRTMTQLLQLQLYSKMDLLSGGSSASDESDTTDFALLLQDLLGAAGQTSSALEPIRQAELARFAQSSPVSSPSTVQALPKVFQAPYVAALNHPTAYDPIISTAAAQHGVQPALIKAVINAESSFNANAVSPAGAKGLMQLMDDTGQGLGVTDPFDAEQNIQGGTKFLAYLLNKYDGSEATALAAYNAGPGRIDRLGIRNDSDLRAHYGSLPKETQAYVDRVLALKHNDQV
jgi:soluble lytic murein transglycosylase-like protein